MVLNTENVRNYIYEELDWDNAVCGTAQIKVEITDSTAVLTGVVPSYSARRAAEKDALTAPGITAVDNRLEVIPPPGAAIHDDDIRVRAEKILEWHSELGSDFRPSVEEGIVHLDGAVDAYWKKIKAEELVSDLNGVRGIVNALAVAPTESIADQAIGENIMTVLKRNSSINISNVNITVKDGVVTLTGSIPNAASRRAVLNAAKYASGVTAVEDRLVLSP
jgi:osmotically-inducible protein OsmY